MESEILYRDGSLAVCLKPPGVVSEEGGMPALLRDQLGGEVFCVHRLDRAVGGVMVYARTKKAAASLSAAIAAGGMRKEYLAVVQGVPDEPRGELRDLLYYDAARSKSYVVTRPRRGVKEALLDYKLVDSTEWEGHTLSALRILLHTGRSHQIRVQFASRGMPLVGDGRYGSAIRLRGPALWSETLSFSHPDGGGELRFSSPPPENFPWALFSFQTN